MSEEEDLDSLGVKPGAVLTSPKSKFVLIKLLGEGGFGAVFLVQDMTSRNKERPKYALKVEKKLDNRRHSKLKMEVAILKEVSSMRTSKIGLKDPERYLRHFTDIVDRAKKDRYFFLVMQLVGKSLADLRLERKDKLLPVGTGLSVCFQCLEAVQVLHVAGYIHRDLKPANYACGLGDKAHVIYLLDFGIARMFMKRIENNKKELKTPRTMVLFKGTVKFASISCHKNLEMGAKDDCESWIYLLIDLMIPKGLPWKRDSEKNEVLKKKLLFRENPHFGNVKCEEDLVKVYKYVDSLNYSDTMDYEFVYTLLKSAAKVAKVDLDAPYEWENPTTENTKK
uniref:Protein kinase domain-containing protein n=1 Tax=Panagrolaimus sp. JU765 TaxID=591449 RepID=A0AC34QR24_9BILA